jgi:hypothetical protein
VDGPAEEQLDIDPRLLEGFALFREAGPGPDGPLDMDESKRVDQLRAMVLSGRIPPLTARGLVFDQVRKVALSPSRTMLAIPGKAGLHVVVRDSDDGVSHGSGSKIAGRIQGRPMMSIGPSLIGFAVRPKCVTTPIASTTRVGHRTGPRLRFVAPRAADHSLHEQSLMIGAIC